LQPILFDLYEFKGVTSKIQITWELRHKLQTVFGKPTENLGERYGFASTGLVCPGVPTSGPSLFTNFRTESSRDDSQRSDLPLWFRYGCGNRLGMQSEPKSRIFFIFIGPVPFRLWLPVAVLPAYTVTRAWRIGTGHSIMTNTYKTLAQFFCLASRRRPS
jgi:hypothetical protein